MKLPALAVDALGALEFGTSAGAAAGERSRFLGRSSAELSQVCSGLRLETCLRAGRLVRES
jgi:hypothetical protein